MPIEQYTPPPIIVPSTESSPLSGQPEKEGPREFEYREEALESAAHGLSDIRLTENGTQVVYMTESGAVTIQTNTADGSTTEVVATQVSAESRPLFISESEVLVHVGTRFDGEKIVRYSKDGDTWSQTGELPAAFGVNSGVLLGNFYINRDDDRLRTFRVANGDMTEIEVTPPITATNIVRINDTTFAASRTGIQPESDVRVFEVNPDGQLSVIETIQFPSGDFLHLTEGENTFAVSTVNYETRQTNVHAYRLDEGTVTEQPVQTLDAVTFVDYIMSTEPFTLLYQLPSGIPNTNRTLYYVEANEESELVQTQLANTEQLGPNVFGLVVQVDHKTGAIYLVRPTEEGQTLGQITEQELYELYLPLVTKQ